MLNTNFPTFIKNFSLLRDKWTILPAHHRTILKLLSIFIILATISITVNLLQQQQNLTQEAATPSPTKTPTPTPSNSNTTPPVINSIAVSGITNNSASVSWYLSKPGTGQVEYGTTTNYGFLTTLEPNLLTYHSQFILSLTPGTLYHYRIRSKDAAGNLAVSSDSAFSTTGGLTPTPKPIRQTRCVRFIFWRFCF